MAFIVMIFSILSIIPTSVAEDTVGCGELIYGDIILKNNLNCAGDGVTIVSGNITLDCNNNAIVGHNTGTGISGLGIDHITIKNCIISNFSTAIELINANHNTITKNTIKGIQLNNFYGGYGVFISGDSNTINKNQLELFSGGIYNYGKQNTISHNIIKSTNYGIIGSILYDSEIKYNQVVNSTEIGILAQGPNIDVVHNKVTNSNIGYRGDGGFHFVSKNLFEANNKGAILSILRDSEFFNNQFLNNVHTGMELQSSTNNLIHHNTIQGSSYSGLEIFYFSDNSIWKNKFIDNFNQVLVHPSNPASTGNLWTVSVGNYWDDFRDNEGYPKKYVIYPGAEEDIDSKPIKGKK